MPSSKEVVLMLKRTLSDGCLKWHLMFVSGRNKRRLWEAITVVSSGELIQGAGEYGMPTLDWIGKKSVVEHHKEVPFHLLKANDALSVGDPGSGNLLVQGDNLLALKALLPYYAGQVKCVCIDPPYNTGNEGWVYNDNTNSPEIRDWLGRTVGKEAEDLSRHDKWLCMMYPRLVLLREFLREDGAIFVCIDDNEVHTLRMLLDEIFGARNFIATIIWQKVFAPKNSARHFSEDHDYILVYAKNEVIWKPNLIARSAAQEKAYKNPDNDTRGPWTSGDLQARNYYSAGTYPIICPSKRVIDGPGKGMYWRFSEENFHKLDKDGRIWWGKSGDNMPRLKRFLSEVKQGCVPQTLWTYSEVGHTQEAKKELLSVCDFEDSAAVFITPKPTKLIHRILEVSTDSDSIILDSFSGSGSTGHAVLAQNKADGGTRKFILVEMDNDICRNITAQRLSRVSQGHNDIEALGGGFRYCELGEPLFTAEGQINETVSYADLAHYVFFAATGEPLPNGADLKTPLLGVANDVAVYLLYNGILGDKSIKGGNVLTREILAELPQHPGVKIVYGNGCRISSERLKRENVIFRQIPYEVRVS
jgi:site-specific DNA-methyltransferase (adenine-specific)/adenine-specific DNA-methyltransferase